MNVLSFEMQRAAEWRLKKAERFPSDVRNVDAAELLRKLASMSASPEREKAYSEAVEEYLGSEDAVSEALREIGFHSRPASADDVLETVTERIRSIDQDEARRKYMEAAGLTEDDL
ncbi:MAG: hypothetical protein DI549_18335 [Ancylobacter novellus]|uniref:Uncharacterized protein n=1 Tax=Ancylobacter novellus TaxID=921 RepID=A0A2W5SZ77_ANCNO|nr:MAG: hypothetical protein DI549_18335 [Ancylobacter novellus]